MVSWIFFCVELGESNPLTEFCIAADQRLCGQLSGGFRLTGSDL